MNQWSADWSVVFRKSVVELLCTYLHAFLFSLPRKEMMKHGEDQPISRQAEVSSFEEMYNLG
jgi:hypothetical protein